MYDSFEKAVEFNFIRAHDTVKMMIEKTLQYFQNTRIGRVFSHTFNLNEEVKKITD